MTTDQYSAIERKLSRGCPLTNDEARLLLEQLQSNARERVRFEAMRGAK